MIFKHSQNRILIEYSKFMWTYLLQSNVAEDRSTKKAACALTRNKPSTASMKHRLPSYPFLPVRIRTHTFLVFDGGIRKSRSLPGRNSSGQKE
ncbi:hypothetical protein AVEN_156607-1 [Araneus ventricosus]|uniref:Uncharacterized protein n=1 Tax=Araneus ventricosus TaxID=182803 RepID=A0A4Y2I1C3_ARAVE|nr:hypothetical protein AVEN_156042-1 [Araneus ventricosus]GBM71326.1 hypothetical protein AVEN_156607-1 [Araneus ventricosus]